jgi:hypothetical protein
MSVANAKISSMNKNNEARRKAESQALFLTMLKAKHTVITPKPNKGTRQSAKRKAISEQDL